MRFRSAVCGEELKTCLLHPISQCFAVRGDGLVFRAAIRPLDRKTAAEKCACRPANEGNGDLCFAIVPVETVYHHCQWDDRIRRIRKSSRKVSMQLLSEDGLPTGVRRRLLSVVVGLIAMSAAILPGAGLDTSAWVARPELHTFPWSNRRAGDRRFAESAVWSWGSKWRLWSMAVAVGRRKRQQRRRRVAARRDGGFWRHGRVRRLRRRIVSFRLIPLYAPSGFPPFPSKGNRPIWRWWTRISRSRIRSGRIR